MLKRNISCFFVLLCLILFTNCNKGTSNPPVEEEAEWIIYNAQNSGLPNNQVQAIAIDDQNNKWFGTAEGLARLSGSTWTTYTTANSALPSSYITALANDRTGNLWVGTNKGLARYNGTTWTIYNSANSLLLNQEVTRLLYDQNKGELWIGTAAGLVKFDGTTWSRYDEDNSDFFDGFVRSLAIDKNGILWVGTFDSFRFFGRIWKFNGTNWTSTRLDHQGLPSSFPEGMVADDQNVMWIGLKGTMGATLVSVKDDKWDIFNSSASSALHGGINSVLVEGSTKWLSTGSGLVAYDGNNWKSYSTTNSKIPENTLFTTSIDKNGNKWVGTYYSGVGCLKNGN